MPVEHTHHITGNLSGGVGVKVTTCLLHLELEVDTGTLAGTLELEMLEEMGSAGALGSLVAAATFDEY